MLKRTKVYRGFRIASYVASNHASWYVYDLNEHNLCLAAGENSVVWNLPEDYGEKEGIRWTDNHLRQIRQVLWNHVHLIEEEERSRARR